MGFIIIYGHAVAAPRSKLEAVGSARPARVAAAFSPRAVTLGNEHWWKLLAANERSGGAGRPALVRAMDIDICEATSDWQ